MFTNKDIEYRTIYVINCIKDRNLRVSNGELLLENTEEKKTLTKLPFQKILALFVIGHIHITTPLIEKCQKFNVALVVMKPSLRPVFYWSHAAEANYLLRHKQYHYSPDDISIAKVIITNKIANQERLLKKSRKSDTLTAHARHIATDAIQQIPTALNTAQLMGIEGQVSKAFFAAYFQDFDWQARRPRTHCDILNTTLDIGYTYLFNYIECFVRMFGFDPYVGVHHRLWFKRKSLICDLMEPFRCIVDHTVRTAYNRGQFGSEDFDLHKGEFRLKLNKSSEYSRVFFDAFIPYKMNIFNYIRTYYRCFMQEKPMNEYPKFEI